MQFVTRDQIDIEKQEGLSVLDGLAVILDDGRQLEVKENNGQVTFGRGTSEGYQSAILTYNQLDEVINHILVQSEAVVEKPTTKLRKDKVVKNV